MSGFPIFIFFVICVLTRVSLCLDPNRIFCANCLHNKTVEENLPPPVLHCRDEDSLTLLWNSTEKTAYSLEYNRRNNTSDTFFTNLTAGGNATIEKLIPGTNYRIRLWSLSDDQIIYNVSKYIQSTTKFENTSPLPVKGIRVRVLQPKFINNSYTALVKWEPNSDLSCYYEVIWFTRSTLETADQKRIKLKGPIRYTETNLTGLKYNTQYSLSIISMKRNGEQNSLERSKNFKTPTCLESFKSLNYCATPSDLKTEEILIDKIIEDKTMHFFFDIKISWSRRRYIPDNYTIVFFSQKTSMSKYSLVIPGNTTNTTIKHIEIGVEYKIILIAWSKIGPSKGAVVYKQMKGVSMFPVEENAPKFHTVTVVLVSATVIVIIVLIMVFVVRRYRFKKQRLNYKSQHFKDLDLEDKAKLKAPDTVAQIVFDKWETNCTSLVLKEQVGEGAFGIVRKAIFYKNNMKLEVAVKMLKDGPTKEQIEQFYAEIKIMKSVPKHQNLVSLIGVVTKSRLDSPYLLVEMCSKGDLLSWLKKAYARLGFLRSIDWSSGLTKYDNCGNQCNNNFYIQNCSSSEEDYFLNSKTLISVARQICSGMEHLGINKVVHRDLAARNILISKDHTVKVSDFGLSRNVYKSDVYLKTTAGKLPLRWMALESMTHQTYTTESDVWSFGIVLWEIITLGRTPYPTIHTQELLLLLESGYRMQRPSNCSNELHDIMKNCWQRDPKMRPTFTSLKKCFEIFLENETEYLNLYDNPSAYAENYQNGKNTQNINSCKIAVESEYLKPINVKNI